MWKEPKESRSAKRRACPTDIPQRGSQKMKEFDNKEADRKWANKLTYSKNQSTLG